MTRLKPFPLKISQRDDVRGSYKKENYDTFLSDLLQNQEITSIGGYILGETIGKGTYGEVKIATHQLTKQKVAVKIMNKSYGPLALREVQTWRYMRHPNIVQLYEVLASESYIYLIMELASCGEVFDYIVSRGKMKEKEAKKIFYQLANAVDYCHKKGFVHRDLKPENLLLDSSWNLKLVDFGFTRKYDPNRLLDTYCGSVSYVAPEIIKKEKYSGPESDIWSIGVILFTLLCGRLPFDDEHGNDSEVFEKILNLNYKIDNSCSPEAKNLIEGILKLNPKDRLTINDILNHEWLSEFQNENTPKSKNLPNSSSSSTLNSLSSTSSNTSNNPTQSPKSKTSGLVNFYNNIMHISTNHQRNSSSENALYNNSNLSSGSITSNHRQNSSDSTRSLNGHEEIFTKNENDNELLETMKKLGFDYAQLCDSLQNYQPDQLNAIFFLLKKAKDSPNDSNSPTFYPTSPVTPTSSFSDSPIDRYLKKFDTSRQNQQSSPKRGINQLQGDSIGIRTYSEETPLNKLQNRFSADVAATREKFRIVQRSRSGSHLLKLQNINGGENQNLGTTQSSSPLKSETPSSSTLDSNELLISPNKNLLQAFEKEEKEQDEVTSRRTAFDLVSEKTDSRFSNTERKLGAGRPRQRSQSQRPQTQKSMILEEEEEEEEEESLPSSLSSSLPRDPPKFLEKELFKQHLKSKKKDLEKEREKEKEIEPEKEKDKTKPKERTRRASMRAEKDKDKDREKTKEKKKKKTKDDENETEKNDLEVKKEGKIRQVREGLFDHKTTSTMEPIYILTEVIRVLNQKGMTFERDNYKLFVEIDASEGKNEIEITKGLDHSSIPTPLIQSPPRAVEYESSFDSDYQSLQDKKSTSALSSLLLKSDPSITGSQELQPTNYLAPMTSNLSISLESVSSLNQVSKIIKFELEICRLGEKLHGIRLKRLNGDIWTYKTICDSIISELKI